MKLEIFVALQEVAEQIKSVFGNLSSAELIEIVENAGRLGEAEGAEDEDMVIRMIAADVVAQQFVKVSAEVAVRFNEEMAGVHSSPNILTL